MRTLSALAIAAQQAQDSDEVWLTRLTLRHASMTPNPMLFVNDMADLTVFPANLQLTPLIGGWSATGTGTVTALGSLYAVEDTSAAATYILTDTKTGLTSGTTYTQVIRVRKDKTEAAIRFPRFVVTGSNGTTTLYLDTETGSIVSATTGTGDVAQGVLDDGNSWLLYASRTGSTSMAAALSPAAGAGTLGAGAVNVTALGKAHADRPTLYAGVIADRETYISFPFMLDLPGEDPESPSVARLKIDNVDLQIVQAIRGLPSPPTVDFEVVLASQPETIEIGFYDLTMRAADYDALYVEATLTFEQIYTEPCSLEMTPSRFPGLF